ncbi:MAG: SbmA/BacA-like family transporter [Bosea sp. (in: a-proteobacteria)]
MSSGPVFIPFSDLDRRVVWQRFWRVAKTFWTGEQRARAWMLFVFLAAGLILILGVNFSVNRWQSALFNALEKKDAPRAMTVLWLLPLIVVGGAAAGALVVWSRETLQVHWRAWMVGQLSGRWLAEKRYFKLQQKGIEPANPEYRIADDVKMAVEPLVDFAIGWFSALLAAVTFIGVLWSVGGSWSFKAGGSTYTIPAFMVLAAVVYGIGLSLLTWLIGRPLVPAIARRNEAEALLRFELTRVREHAERVAAENGGAEANRSVIATYKLVLERSLIVIRYHVRLTWVTNGNGVLVPIFATALATPKYLAGDMSLGDLVSLGPAFQQVQMAMAWLVDNFRQVALWYASAGRVSDMVSAMDLVDGEASNGPSLSPESSPDAAAPGKPTTN